MRPGDANPNHKSSPNVSHKYDCSHDGRTLSEIFSELRMCRFPSSRPSTGSSASKNQGFRLAHDLVGDGSSHDWVPAVPRRLDPMASGGCPPPIKMPGCTRRETLGRGRNVAIE